MTPHTKYPYRLLGVIYTCLSQRDGIFLLWLHCNFLGIIDKVCSTEEHVIKVEKLSSDTFQKAKKRRGRSRF